MDQLLRKKTGGPIYFPSGVFPKCREIKTNIGSGQPQGNFMSAPGSLQPKQPPASGTLGPSTMTPEQLAQFFMITQFSRSTQPLATQLITSQQPLIPTPQTHPSSLQLIGSQTIGPQYCNTNPNAFQYQKNPGFHINNQFQPLSPLEYRQDTLPFVQTPAQPINNQYEQQHQGGVQQQPLANMIVDVVRE